MPFGVAPRKHDKHIRRLAISIISDKKFMQVSTKYKPEFEKLVRSIGVEKIVIQITSNQSLTTQVHSVRHRNLTCKDYKSKYYLTW